VASLLLSGQSLPARGRIQRSLEFREEEHAEEEAVEEAEDG